jgi:hypothetical protein
VANRFGSPSQKMMAEDLPLLQISYRRNIRTRSVENERKKMPVRELARGVNEYRRWKH